MNATLTAVGRERPTLLPPFVVTAFLVAIVLPLEVSIAGTVFTSVRVVVLLAVIPLLIGLLRGHYGRVLLVDWLFIAHTAWMGISLGVTTPQMAISQFGSVGSDFLGSYLIGRCLIRDWRGFVSTIWLALCLLLFLLPFVVVEMLTGQPPIINILDKLPFVHSFAPVWTEPRMGLERAQAVFPHPIHFGLFSASLVALVYTGLNDLLAKWQRFFLLGLVAFGTFASLSSGALLPMILQVALIGWGIAMHKVPRKWLILGILCIAGYIVLEVFSTRSAMIAILTRLTFSSHNVYWRSIIFEWGWMNIFGSVENGIPPARLFGIGFNDWIRPSYMYSGSMDNFWLVMGVRHGIPGFLTVAGGMGWLIWKAAQHDMGADRVVNDIRLAWVLTFICLGLSMATVHAWGTIYDYIFFLFGSGAWLTTYVPAAETGAEPMAGSSSPGGRRTPVYSRFGDQAASSSEAPSHSHRSADPVPGPRPVLLRHEDTTRSYRRPALGAPDSPTRRG